MILGRIGLGFPIPGYCFVAITQSIKNPVGDLSALGDQLVDVLF